MVETWTVQRRCGGILWKESKMWPLHAHHPIPTHSSIPFPSQHTLDQTKHIYHSFLIPSFLPSLDLLLTFFPSFPPSFLLSLTFFSSPSSSPFLHTPVHIYSCSSIFIAHVFSLFIYFFSLRDALMLFSLSSIYLIGNRNNNNNNNNNNNKSVFYVIYNCVTTKINHKVLDK